MSKKQLDEKSIQKNHFDYNFEISKKFKLRDSHRSFVELGVLKDTNMMFIDGPAGSAKTYCAAYLGLNMLKTRAVDEIIYIRSIIESASKSMGSLPGEIDDKFYPWSIPLKEKLDELLECDVIEPVPPSEATPWVSPLLAVPKPNNDNCFSEYVPRCYGRPLQKAF